MGKKNSRKNSMKQSKVLTKEKPMNKIDNEKLQNKIKSLNHRNSIRVGLVGCVSSGKSTILNSICVNQYEDMKIKRTTMVPSVYMESNDIIHGSGEISEIHSRNQKINKEMYEKDKDLKLEDINKMEYIIPKIRNFINLPEHIYLDIYDIPGLNDGKTKDVFFKWIDQNFGELDIILHIVDINSPLNTSDQIDILKMIIKNIENEKMNNNREVFLLTIINKCDEMDIDEKTGEFIFDEEDQENYDQVVKYTMDTIKETAQDMNNIKCEFTPLSAADTFVYRMLHNDANVELDMKLLQKFGINEVGKRKWSKLNDNEKKCFIREHFKDCDINDTLQLTGYNKLKSEINNYLTKSKQSDILISRLEKELKDKTIVDKTFSKDKEETNKLIELYNSYCQKVYVIDQLYNTNNSKMISDLIYIHLQKWINDISDLSNENLESINRLKEYKELIQMFIDNIDSYALTNKIKLDIENDKKHRWSSTFGSEIDKINKPFSVITMFKNMFSGYSKLQNEYYLKKLQDYNNYKGSNYDSFCEMIYENLDCLRDNSFDNIEKTIDDCIVIIQDILKAIHFNNPYQKNQYTPIHTYCDYKIETPVLDSHSTIIEFCRTLIRDYDYPKIKIIKFLQFYITKHYKLVKSKPGGIINIKECHAYYQNAFKSYIILFDTWIKTEGPKLSDEYSDFMKNLFIINKSYMHHSQDLDINLNYVSMKDIVLETPMYLYDLIQNETGDDETDETDEIGISEIGFCPENLTEIIYEGKDYFLNESTNVIYTMDGFRIGLWNDEKGIILM